MTKRSEKPSGTVAAVEWHRRYAPQRVLLALGILALFDIGFYLAAVRPAARAEQVREARYEELLEQVERARANVEQIQTRAERIDKADRDGNALVEEAALPRRSAFSELLTELGAASASAGIEMRETSYAIEALEGSDRFGLLGVDATFRGSYENLLQFLYQLDRSDLFFIISSLGATPRGESNSNELQIQMRFDTLVRDF